MTDRSEPRDSPSGAGAQNAAAEVAPPLSPWGRGRVPLILQAEAAECGLACLAMVAGAHGLDIDLLSLRRRFDVSLKGMSAEALLQLAAQLRLDGEGLSAEPAQLRGLALPCILHWDLNHFVVLVRCDSRGATLHDPAVGRRRISWAELSRHFSGVVLALRPAAGFSAERQRERISIRRLMGPVHGLRGGLARILVLALALEGFVLLTPFFMQWVVDEVIVSGDRDLLIALGIGFSMLVLFQAATAAIRSWAVLALSAELNLQWLRNVFGHLLRLPLGWFERRQLGDIWSRYQSVQTIQRTLTTSFVEAVLDGVMVLLTVAMMALYSLKLLAVALSAMAVYALVRWAMYRPLRQASEEALVMEARQNGGFIETLRGMQAIKLFNAQVQRRQLFAAQAAATMNAQLATRSIEAGFGVLQRLLFGLERVAVIWLGALLVLERQLSVGMLLAFFAYKEQFALRVAALIDKAVELKMLRLQGERVADIALAAPEETTAAASAPPLQQPPSIELRGVVFRHSAGDAPVLRGVDLQVAAGTAVAIVGPSGCGKSTLVKIVLGLLEPSDGEVLVNGQPLSRLGLAAWRGAVGVVMQDDQLFSGSIAANIAFFGADAQPDWIEQCARRAGVHEDIVAMPMGYETLIGDMGSALSGGQRQRVLLARALYKRPLVLVLDEATSALDVAGERVVNDAVGGLSLTRIVVAHRPETVAAVGRVVELRQGQVVADSAAWPNAR